MIYFWKVIRRLYIALVGGFALWLVSISAFSQSIVIVNDAEEYFSKGIHAIMEFEFDQGVEWITQSFDLAHPSLSFTEYVERSTLEVLVTEKELLSLSLASREFNKHPPLFFIHLTTPF